MQSASVVGLLASVCGPVGVPLGIASLSEARLQGSLGSADHEEPNQSQSQ